MIAMLDNNLDKMIIFVGELFEAMEIHSRLKSFARFLSVPYFDFMFCKVLTIN